MSMSVSFKKETGKTNIKHNNRKMNEQEKERNSHINYSLSHENKYLVQESLRELYKREFGEATEKYNAKQKRADRQIKDYYKHVQASKKTSLQQEMIVQIGDKDEFSSKENVKTANEILEKWFSTFEERNPNLKVYNAVIHNDEASPHLHINFVPVASGYKRGLEKQVSFDRAITQQDSILDKVRPFEDWREKEVQLLEKLLNERGIERELVGTNEYKDVNEYKEKKDQLRKLEKEIDRLRTVLPAEKESVPFLRKEIETEVKTKMIGKPEITERETGNYVLTPEQYNDVIEKFHAATVIQKDYEWLKSTDLVIENENLRGRQEKMLKEISLVRKREEQLKQEKAEIQQENNVLQNRMRDLLLEIRMTYQSAKDLVSDHTTSLKDFRTVFKRFGEKVKGKTSEARENLKMEPRVTEFEKINKKELARDRDQGMER